ncbi:MAG TPA: UTP--glucose-1-phosphate uridylyltransferase GalU [Bacillus bacterium]|nr:UTP--glucose-1-phosphate uridylyltransferase GalU [Bacillus sp. (in: firmicutes)]
MLKVRKAVIPAAGLGTRFLPATKAQPKEMLPIVDTPTIQYIVEEAVASGIEDIIIISGRNKRAIEDHFDKSYELEETLVRKEKYDLLEQIQGISNLANIHYIRQKEAKGLGDAIYCASRFIGNEPFAVLLGDIIIKSETPSLQQLLQVYNRYHTSVIGVKGVPNEEVSKYGIIDPNGTALEENVFAIKELVEKPSSGEAPSNYAIIGRYILTPNIFKAIEETPYGAGNEIQLTDAIQRLGEQKAIFACAVEGSMYDIGDKFGFVKATIDFALERSDLKSDVETYIGEIYQKLHSKVGM